MTIQPMPCPALPVGADDNPEFGADWQPGLDDGTFYRVVWTPDIDVENDIRGGAVQYDDGSIVAEGDDAPLVYISCLEYSPDDARRIADGIRAVADQLDVWAGRPVDPRVALAEARQAVLRAYRAVVMLSGGADSYTRAALDSIDDAIEAVTR